MNRTTAFLGIAAALLLTAVVVGLPKHGPTVTPSPPVPPPPQVVPQQPQPPPVVVGNPGSLTMTGKLSHPYLVPGTSDVFATLEVSAVDVPNAKRAPVNLSLVIDRSGSMTERTRTGLTRWQAVTTALQTVLSGAMLARHLPGAGRGRVRWDVLRQHWRFSAGISGISVLSILLTQVDKIVVGRLFSLAELGYYTLAGTVGNALYYLIGDRL